MACYRRRDPQAITLRDTDFGMVRLRAFGMYSYAIADARKFFVGISGTRAAYTRDDLEEQLRGILVSTMAARAKAKAVWRCCCWVATKPAMTAGMRRAYRWQID